MPALLTGTEAYAQFITVLVIFVIVLGICAYTTKWLADYQKKQGRNKNIDIVETARIGNNKWVQIVRVGDTYKILAVCKDTVTYLGDLEKEQIDMLESLKTEKSFKEVFSSAISSKNAKNAMYGEKKSDE